MKKRNFLSAQKWLKYVLLALAISSCSGDGEDEVTEGNWIERSPFGGISRYGAVSVVVDNKVYIGLGYDNDDRLTDWWVADANLTFWTRKADFPAAGRNSAVAFSANGKAYVGTGYDGEDERKDFYEYDPATDSWKQVADFMGTARYGAVAFSDGNFGYVGTGFDGNSNNDFYKYDPIANSWEQIISHGGGKRRNAVAFVLDGKAYVGTGINNGVYLHDFWAYDFASETWQQKQDLDEEDDYDISRSNAVGLAFNGFGYVATGLLGSLITTTWQYDPTADRWREKTKFEGAARESGVGFVINGRGYVSTGKASLGLTDDVWELAPNIEYDEED